MWLPANPLYKAFQPSIKLTRNEGGPSHREDKRSLPDYQTPRRSAHVAVAPGASSPGCWRRPRTVRVRLRLEGRGVRRGTPRGDLPPGLAGRDGTLGVTQQGDPPKLLGLPRRQDRCVANTPAFLVAGTPPPATFRFPVYGAKFRSYQEPCCLLCCILSISSHTTSPACLSILIASPCCG